MQEVIVPLNLTGTFYYQAPTEVGILPGKDIESGYYGFIGDITP